MTRAPFVLAPEEGEIFHAGPFHIVARVRGDESEQAFEMYDLALGPATVDYHVHNTMDETIFVLEGRLSSTSGGRSSCVPREPWPSCPVARITASPIMGLAAPACY